MININELSEAELVELEIALSEKNNKSRKELNHYTYDELNKLIDCSKFPDCRILEAYNAIDVLATFATTNYVKSGKKILPSKNCYSPTEYRKVCDELLGVVKNYFDRNRLYRYFENLDDEETKNVTETNVKRSNNIFVSKDMVNLMLINTSLTEEEIMEKLGYAGEKLSNRYITKETYDKIESILKKS